VLFRCDTLGHALGYYAALVGLSGADPTLHPVAQYANPLVVMTLAIGAIFATPVAATLARWRDRAIGIRATEALVIGVDGAWLALVFVASAAMLAAGTYNPFIYFRF
jgi:alginate O-acetyltransferase complex protein AlgI